MAPFPVQHSAPHPGSSTLRLVVGAERHAVEVSWSAPLRLLRVRLDGRTVYRHWGLLPWATRKAREIRTPGRELHTLIVQPPARGRGGDAARAGYRLWVDGTPVAATGSRPTPPAA
jgi:hypothetical protein